MATRMVTPLAYRVGPEGASAEGQVGDESAPSDSAASKPAVRRMFTPVNYRVNEKEERSDSPSGPVPIQRPDLNREADRKRRGSLEEGGVKPLSVTEAPKLGRSARSTSPPAPSAPPSGQALPCSGSMALPCGGSMALPSGGSMALPRGGSVVAAPQACFEPRGVSSPPAPPAQGLHMVPPQVQSMSQAPAGHFSQMLPQPPQPARQVLATIHQGRQSTLPSRQVSPASSVHASTSGLPAFPGQSASTLWTGALRSVPSSTRGSPCLTPAMPLDAPRLSSGPAGVTPALSTSSSMAFTGVAQADAPTPSFSSRGVMNRRTPTPSQAEQPGRENGQRASGRCPGATAEASAHGASVGDARQEPDTESTPSPRLAPKRAPRLSGPGSKAPGRTKSPEPRHTRARSPQPSEARKRAPEAAAEVENERSEAHGAEDDALQHARLMESLQKHLRQSPLALQHELLQQQLQELQQQQAKHLEKLQQRAGDKVKESPQEVASRLRQMAGDGIYFVCVVGSMAVPGKTMQSLIASLAKELHGRLPESVTFALQGLSGVPKAFAEHLPEGARAWNLLCQKQKARCRQEVQAVCAGEDMEEALEVFSCVGDVYLVLEGGPDASKVAKAVLQRGGSVVPIMRTGSESFSQHGFPPEALERPPFVGEACWALLSDDKAPIAATSAAASAAVAGCLANWCRRQKDASSNGTMSVTEASARPARQDAEEQQASEQKSRESIAEAVRSAVASSSQRGNNSVRHEPGAARHEPPAPARSSRESREGSSCSLAGASGAAAGWQATPPPSASALPSAVTPVASSSTPISQGLPRASSPPSQRVSGRWPSTRATSPLLRMQVSVVPPLAVTPITKSSSSRDFSPRQQLPASPDLPGPLGSPPPRVQVASVQQQQPMHSWQAMQQSIVQPPAQPRYRTLSQRPQQQAPHMSLARKSVSPQRLRQPARPSGQMQQPQQQQQGARGFQFHPEGPPSRRGPEASTRPAAAAGDIGEDWVDEGLHQKPRASSPSPNNNKGHAGYFDSDRRPR